MTNNNDKINYAAPQCELLTVQSESVIAASAEFIGLGGEEGM